MSFYSEIIKYLRGIMIEKVNKSGAEYPVY